MYSDHPAIIQHGWQVWNQNTCCIGHLTLVTLVEHKEIRIYLYLSWAGTSWINKIVSISSENKDGWSHILGKCNVKADLWPTVSIFCYSQRLPVHCLIPRGVACFQNNYKILIPRKMGIKGFIISHINDDITWCTQTP